MSHVIDLSLCESPIERRIVLELSPQLHTEARLTLQFPVKTGDGNHRLDIVLHNDRRVFGIECDGRDFHNYREDLRRDLSLLSSKQLTGIFRFSGRSINAAPESCVSFIRLICPEMFSNESSSASPTLSQIAEIGLMGTACSDGVLFRWVARAADVDDLAKADAKKGSICCIGQASAGNPILQVRGPRVGGSGHAATGIGDIYNDMMERMKL